MTSGRKFYLNTLTIQVLSEDTPITSMDVGDVAYAISDGDCVGGAPSWDSVELLPQGAVLMLHAFGSDPAFFMLTEDGDDTEDML